MEKRTIDWKAIKLRLEVATAAASGEQSPGVSERNRILEARARKASQAPEMPNSIERIEVLTFSLAAELYAIETTYVREVCQLKNLTSIPRTPSFLAGAMSLRGRILAIVDLRIFFELPTRGLTELNKVIVLNSGDNELGLLADSIDGVRSMAAPDFREGFATPADKRGKFLKGITDRMLALLDGGHLLTDSSLKVNEQTSG